MPDSAPIEDLVVRRTELERLVERLERLPVLGLDTEFERTRTFFARLALVQIHDGSRAYILDPLAVEDLTPLGRLLRDYRGVIAMHAPSEDLEILSRLTGHRPRRLFDTQLAAAFAGLGANLGYDRLVESLFGVKVSKAATRSDWLQRPLTRAQLEYAVADCAYLPAAQERLSSTLDALGRTSWLEEETASVLRRAEESEAARDYSRLVRRVADDDRVRGRLLALCRWRESTARQRDRPRRRIASDALLIACAVRAPTTREALESVVESLGEHRRRVDDGLLTAVSAARTAPPEARPVEAENLRPHRARLRRMKAALAQRAAELELPQGLLASTRLLETLVVARLVRAQPLPAELTGWRAEVVLPAMLAALDDD